MGLRSLWGAADDSGSDGNLNPETQVELVAADRRVASIIERGSEELVRQIAPNSLVFDETYFKVGDVYCRGVYLDQWPVDVEANWLRSILQWPRAMDVAIYYEPLPDKTWKSKLRTKIGHLKAALEQADLAGEVPDSDMIQEWEDASELLDLLQRGMTKPFSVSLQIMLRARSLRELNEMSEQIQKTFEGMNANTRTAELRQRDALLSAMPYGRNYIRDSYSTRNMHTQAAMYTFPLANADLAHPSGVWYGINKMTNSNVIIDRGLLQSPHMLVLGASGSGKSYGAKQEMLRVNMRGYPIIVVDPEGETERLAMALGGQFITISANSPDRINCLDFSAIADGIEDQLSPKIASVLKLIGTIMNPEAQGYGLNAEQVSLLDMLLRSTYAKFGYTQNEATQTPVDRGGYCQRERMPILSDLRAEIQAYLDQNEHNPQIQALLRPIHAGLGPYCAGGTYAGLFDEHTTVDLRSDFVAFNIRALTRDEHLMSLGMHSVLDFIWSQTMNNRQKSSGMPRYLYIDEAHVMMRSPESAQFLEDLLRRARKFGVAVTVLSQSPEDFVRPDRPQGRAIFDNSSMIVTMRMKLRALEMLQDLLGLDDNEVNILANAQTGESMIFALNDRAWVDMRTASPREHMLISTNPAETPAFDQQIREELAAYQQHHQLSSGNEGFSGHPAPDFGHQLHQSTPLAEPQPAPSPVPESRMLPAPSPMDRPRVPSIGRPQPISQIGGERQAPPTGIRAQGPPAPIQNPQPDPSVPPVPDEPGRRDRRNRG